jgi:phosphate/sulfate permease
VDHIICDVVGACVASTMEEMEWNTQGKGIFVEHFISPVIGV